MEHRMFDLSGKTALVTGAAGGIGSAISHALAKQGARLALSGTNPAKLRAFREELNDTYGHDHVEITCDLSNTEQVEHLIPAAVDTLGKIDILVNNAGITGGNAKLWELTPEIWRRVVEVNLIAPFLTCHAIVPEMQKNGYGRIVNIASIAGKDGNPNASHYSASKAGLIGLTKSLGKELSGANVLVNCITPAAARTDIFKQMAQEHIDFMLSKIPMNRFLEVEEAAAMIAWLASEDCSFSTGAVFDISGGRAVY
jgi:3-oxoacyl-[acyl-carrier protein] reductase